MSVHPHAGKLPAPDMLVHVPALVSAYYTQSPQPVLPEQRVSFGTSGHRGSSLKSTFNEVHLHAIVQAICDYRLSRGIDGPLFLGGDTHALSEAAFRSALEVLTANAVSVRVASQGGYTATPVISHAILCWNADRKAEGRADGIIITPSHNPPADGGIKYNPPHGGPAETEITSWIERRANAYLQQHNAGVRRLPYLEARRSALVQPYDFTTRYVEDLGTVIDMDSIAASGLRWVGPVCPCGNPLPGVTACISRWSMPKSTPHSASFPVTGTAKYGWTARRPMPCAVCWTCGRTMTLPLAAIRIRTGTAS